MNKINSIIAFCSIFWCSGAFGLTNNLNDLIICKNIILWSDSTYSVVFFTGVRSDHNIIIAGSSCENDGLCHIIISCYSPNGELFKPFGVNGKCIYKSDEGRRFVKLEKNIAILQPDDKLLISAASSQGMMQKYSALIRISAEGFLDTTFASGGVIDKYSETDFADFLCVEKDGKIIAAGQTFLGEHKVVVTRYFENGKTDSTFGIKGKTIIDLAHTEDVIQSLFIENDRIIIVKKSRAFDPGKIYLSIVRLSLNGIIDYSFGNKGELIISIDNPDR